MDATSGEVVGVTEAARLIGRSHTTIGRWIDEGILESITDEKGRRLVRLSELATVAGIPAPKRSDKRI